MIFLHGGGDNPTYRTETFGRFGQAAASSTSAHLALIVAEPTGELAQESYAAYRAIFTALPNAPNQITPVFVSPEQPLTHQQLAMIQPSGVFVCGGRTPFYHQSICHDPTWVQYLQAARIPYGGTSAGAAIAANTAILGGWQAARHGDSREILFRGASEGVDPLMVCPGLALVPFAVEVHASQMGTLTRLVHAVEMGLAAAGWAIDENTLLQVDGNKLAVYGSGHVYRVWRDNDLAVRITIQTANGLGKDDQ